MQPNAVAFHPDGEVLVVGFSNGLVKFLSVESLEDIGSAAPSTDSVLALKFSSSGEYLAGCDGGNHVFLFKKYVYKPYKELAQ
jgi:WD40 repeat protein